MILVKNAKLDGGLLRMELTELVLIWACGHVSGFALMLLIVWAAEKTGRKRDFYYNTESEEYEE